MIRFLRIATALVLLLVVLAAATWWLARPADPGAFYAANGPVPAGPGRLVAAEPMAAGLPETMRAWRILYTTTRHDGSPAVASAVLAAPAAPAEAPRPVAAYAHGTVGVAPGCAPSLRDSPLPALPAPEAIAAEGWVVVATDYVGLGTDGGHAYLVGEESGRAVLDSIRAAGELAEAGADPAAGALVWGHSQGGHSAIWSGILAPRYAPEIALRGVAAIAPASDIPALIEATQALTIGKLLSSYIVEGMATAYPEADPWSHVAWLDRPIARDIAGRCLGGPETLLSFAQTWALPEAGIFAVPHDEGALGERLEANVPRAPLAVPLLVAQGSADELVLRSIQDGWVAARCGEGQEIDYRVVEGEDHSSIMAGDSPLAGTLLPWMRERLAGEPTAAACPAP